MRPADFASEEALALFVPADTMMVSPGQAHS
jgi:hypothetical protein